MDSKSLVAEILLMESETELQPVGPIDSGFTSSDPESAGSVAAEMNSTLKRQPHDLGADDVEISVNKLSVHDDHQEPNKTSPPQNPRGSREKLDYVIIALVLSAAIVFAVFQISECVDAHQSPSSLSRTLERARLFPGLMICPFTTPEMFLGPYDYCPTWEDDALLSFNYDGRFPRAFNTNVNYRETGRLQSLCPKNIKKSQRSITATGVSFSLEFGVFLNTATSAAPPMNNYLSFAREVIVKNLQNDQHSDSEWDSNLGRPSCLRWTPPNVKCLVYDPLEFDNMAKVHGLDAKCNPMKETAPNSLDSFQVAFNIPDLDSTFSSQAKAPGQGFEYRGLIPPTSYGENGAQIFDAPPSQFASFDDLQKSTAWFGWNSTFFGGLMTVMYDPTEGIPTKLDFYTAPFIVNNQEGSFVTSQIFTSKTIVESQPASANAMPTYEFKFTKPTGPIVVAVDSAIQKTFTNAVLNQMKETVKYFLSFSFSVDKKKTYDDKYFDFSMQFVSSQSTLTEEVVKISILTTISIILSTTATLWGSRENVKEGLLLIRAKTSKILQGSCFERFFENIWKRLFSRMTNNSQARSDQGQQDS
jgi:hypothetical protein